MTEADQILACSISHFDRLIVTGVASSEKFNRFIGQSQAIEKKKSKTEASKSAEIAVTKVCSPKGVPPV